VPSGDSTGHGEAVRSLLLLCSVSRLAALETSAREERRKTVEVRWKRE
jgi:hypothetical protein